MTVAPRPSVIPCGLTPDARTRHSTGSQMTSEEKSPYWKVQVLPAPQLEEVTASTTWSAGIAA